MTPSRRAILAGGMGWLAAGPAFAAPQPDWAAMEQRLGGRLGVWSSSGLVWRADERFLMCSTFKGLLAGAVLAKVDAGTENLERMIPYGPADLLEYAPVTRAHVSEGRLPVHTLCEAAVEVSDNTAANLLLAATGGPAALTGFIRTLGDGVTRLDRNEPTLNVADGEKDTTSPKAIAASYGRLVLGEKLKPASKALLADWMVKGTTGTTKLRARLPEGWRAGDKTGNGRGGVSNDVAILWPPHGAPVMVAAYTMGVTATDAERDAVFADIGRMAAERAHG
jgi:beta-lactamase class A